MFDSSQTPYQGVLHPTTPSATGAIPVQVSTGRPVARGQERMGSTTPMQMSARRPSTMNSFLPAEVPQNSMSGQQRTRSSRIPTSKKKGQSGGTESPKRGSVSSWKTDRLHDLRLLSSHSCS